MKRCVWLVVVLLIAVAGTACRPPGQHQQELTAVNSVAGLLSKSAFPTAGQGVIPQVPSKGATRSQVRSYLSGATSAIDALWRTYGSAVGLEPLSWKPALLDGDATLQTICNSQVATAKDHMPFYCSPSLYVPVDTLFTNWYWSPYSGSTVAASTFVLLVVSLSTAYTKQIYNFASSKGYYALPSNDQLAAAKDFGYCLGGVMITATFGQQALDNIVVYIEGDDQSEPNLTYKRALLTGAQGVNPGACMQEFWLR